MEDGVIKFDEALTFTDERGNTFQCRGGAIKLRLHKTEKLRVIGRLVKIKGLIIYKKREWDSDFYRKTNSWTIPPVIFDKVDGIWIQTETADFKVLTAYVRRNRNLIPRLDKTEMRYDIDLPLWSVTLKNPEKEKTIDATDQKLDM